MSELSVLKILLKLAAFNETVPRKLVNSVCSRDLDLVA